MTFRASKICGWLVIAIYYVSTTLGHLRFSDWLVSPRDMAWRGRTLEYAYRDALPVVLPVAALLLLAWLCREAMRHGLCKRTAVVAGYWLLWAGCVAAVDRYLTFSLPEYAHYPQYGLLAWLIARALDPARQTWPIGRVLFWTTLLGAADEMAQYLWITTRYSGYFDFNDVLVNLLAATLGVMVFYGFRAPPTHRAPATPPARVPVETWVAGVLILVTATLFYIGLVVVTPPQAIPPGGIAPGPQGDLVLFLQRDLGYYGSWQVGVWRARHWVLAPWQGLGLAALVGLMWWPWRRGA